MNAAVNRIDLLAWIGAGISIIIGQANAIAGLWMATLLAVIVTALESKAPLSTFARRFVPAAIALVIIYSLAAGDLRLHDDWNMIGPFFRLALLALLVIVASGRMALPSRDRVPGERLRVIALLGLVIVSWVIIATAGPLAYKATTGKMVILIASGVALALCGLAAIMPLRNGKLRIASIAALVLALLLVQGSHALEDVANDAMAGYLSTQPESQVPHGCSWQKQPRLCVQQAAVEKGNPLLCGVKYMQEDDSWLCYLEARKELTGLTSCDDLDMGVSKSYCTGWQGYVLDTSWQSMLDLSCAFVQEVGLDWRGRLDEVVVAYTGACTREANFELLDENGHATKLCRQHGEGCEVSSWHTYVVRT